MRPQVKPPRFWTLALTVVVVTVGVWPHSYLASPKWEIWVVDESGSPLKDMYVQLDYHNYSTEGAYHELTAYTDKEGHASFPAKYGTWCIFARLYYTALSATAGAHASFGPSASVFAEGQGRRGSALTAGSVTDWQGYPETVQPRIIAKSSTPVGH